MDVVLLAVVLVAAFMLAIPITEGFLTLEEGLVTRFGNKIGPSFFQKPGWQGGWLPNGAPSLPV